MAHSTDNGRTWTEYDKNPVVKHAGRDPKLVWYEKGKHWVMAVYDEEDKKQWITFYTSPDLKVWKFASRIEGFYECPDLFELPIHSHGIFDRQTKWVLYGADGKYLVGEFDGKEFKPDHKEKKQLWYGNFYAAQTFDDGPGRHPEVGADFIVSSKRIQLGWAQGVTFPGMPFNQQMTAPVYLMLWKGSHPAKPDEIRLTANPVDELWSLREARPVLDVSGGKRLTAAGPTTLADGLDAFDAMLSIQPGKGKGFTLNLRGTKLVYDDEKQTLSCKNVTAPAKPWNDVIILRILVDRGSVEVFADESTLAMSIAAIPDEKNRAIELIPIGGEVTVRAASVYRMKSAWEK
jgi:fructan beta-fructosidase